MRMSWSRGRELYLELWSTDILLLAQIQPPEIPLRTLSWSPFSVECLRVEKGRYLAKWVEEANARVQRSIRPKISYVLGTVGAEHTI